MMSISEYLKSIGLNTVPETFRTRIDGWMEWYKGDVESFHRYTVFNGIRTVGVERARLCMAKTVAEDWANLLLNEHVRISAELGQAQLDQALERNRFSVEGNRTVECAFASGTGAFSEFIGEDGQPCIDYHDARSIWPLSWHGRRIAECAFSSVEMLKGRACVYLRLYLLNEDGTYRIENRWLDCDDGSPLPAPEGVMECVDTGIKTPLFQVFSPNIANNVDATCPMGISIYANAISALKGVDTVFDSFVSEFSLGRKRLMVPISMVQVERMRNGGTAPVFDPNDLVFTAYQPSEDQSDGFHELSPELRADAHLTGLRTQLNMLSIKCGLGTNRYEFDRASGVRTATEVISEQSDLYQSLRKHELVLKDALKALAAALLELMGVKGGAIGVRFDDSIIQDRSALRAEARAEVAAGLMSRQRYLTQIAGLSEKEAEEELKHISGKAGE